MTGTCVLLSLLNNAADDPVVIDSVMQRSDVDDYRVFLVLTTLRYIQPSVRQRA